MNNSVKRAPTFSPPLTPPPATITHCLRLFLQIISTVPALKSKLNHLSLKFKFKNFWFTFFGYHRLRPAYA